MVIRYNKINGVSMSQNKEMIEGLLRDEWQYDGVVMSDFEGTYTQNEAIMAGLDLEMPGPMVHRGPALVKAIKEGTVPEERINYLAGNIMKLAAKVGMWDEDAPEKSLKDPEIESLVRQIATEGFVLLQNKDSVLPIKHDRKIAVFGYPAQNPTIHGGGSSSLSASYVSKPIEALENRFGGSNITYHPGVPTFMKIPSAPLSIMRKESDGKPGVDCYWYNGSVIGENKILHETLETTRTLIIHEQIKALEVRHCTRMAFVLTPVTSGTHTFGITANGLTKLSVDGVHILQHNGFDRTEIPYIMEPGRFEVRADMQMEGGKDYHVIIDTLSTTALSPPPPTYKVPPQATQVGFYENLNMPVSDEIKRLATESDISIVFVVANKEYESESFDRESLSLSAPQNRLVEIVSGTSTKTVVVNMTGSPVSMPWIESVDAILQCWFAGQEVGNALAEVLSGDVSPSGKLPVTFPVRIEDTPSFGNFPTDDNHEVRYAEGLEMGYRARNGPKPLFPFAFGLSYTNFKVSNFQVDGDGGMDASVRLVLKNVGDTLGKELVQVYVDGVLKAFSKHQLEAGAEKLVTLKLDKYAFSIWDIQRKAWFAVAREYIIDVRSDANTVLVSQSFIIDRELIWTGL
jgi:beta-glucosidase